jgi:hypothetical protein
MALKIFYDTDEAAKWVLHRSGEPTQVSDIHRLAESGMLPVCYFFRGNVGVFDRPAAAHRLATDVMRMAFDKAKRKAYFPGGYLRSTGSANLGVVVQRLSTKAGKQVDQVDRVNQVSVGPVTIAKPPPRFDGLDFDSETEVLWPLEDSGSRSHGPAIAASHWLFHVDDLTNLVQGCDRPSQTVDNPDRRRLDELPMSKSALIRKYQDKWPEIESDLSSASRNGLLGSKAGSRGWYESSVLEWARSKGKWKGEVGVGNQFRWP